MDKTEVLDNFKRNFNAEEAFGNEFEWGEENCSKSKEDKNLVTLSTLSPKYGGMEASP